MINGYDVELEREHRELVDLERDRDAAEHTGVHCSRCLHDYGCEHTQHLVEGLRRLDEREQP